MKSTPLVQGKSLKSLTRNHNLEIIVDIKVQPSLIGFSENCMESLSAFVLTMFLPLWTRLVDLAVY
jgi:hypothetical protein